jgi:2-C-methyl-D-erythritol 4-phosphate cytidylyltransferase
VTVALILAAGRGERLGASRPKALAELAGRPLLQWSVDALSAVPSIERIVVALPPGAGASAALRLPSGATAASGVKAASGARTAPGMAWPPGVTVPAGTIGVPGGAVRSESVRLALAAAGPGDPVLVHDAARPLLTRELTERVIAAALGDGVDAAIAAAPVTDTVKRVGERHAVLETLDRTNLWAVQTPQVFRRAALERALDVSDEVLAQATDDAWLIERAGGTVVVVESPRENLKVTTPLDLALAELLVAGRTAVD